MNSHQNNLFSQVMKKKVTRVSQKNLESYETVFSITVNSKRFLMTI